MGRKSKIEAHPQSEEIRWGEYAQKLKSVYGSVFSNVLSSIDNGDYNQASDLCKSLLGNVISLETEYKSAIKWANGHYSYSYPSRNYRFTKEDREYVIRKYKRKCAYCGKKGDALNGPDGVSWQLDHIIPYSWQGATERGNLALSCRRCNAKKHNRWWFPHA